MSWEQPTGDPSPAASGADGDVDASAVRIRGLELLDALERFAPGSRDHADAAASYAFAMAVELGLGRDQCELIREVARLHDVGRLYLAQRVATSPRSDLTAAEVDELERSPAAGGALARGAGVPEQAATGIAATAERYDGHGPMGLRGESIPLTGRIARVACAYTGVVERTGAGAPLVRDEPRALAISELRAQAGSALDTSVVEALAAVVDRAAASAR